MHQRRLAERDQLLIALFMVQQMPIARIESSPSTSARAHDHQASRINCISLFFFNCFLLFVFLGGKVL
jgi:hypothetical protein